MKKYIKNRNNKFKKNWENNSKDWKWIQNKGKINNINFIILFFNTQIKLRLYFCFINKNKYIFFLLLK